MTPKGSPPPARAKGSRPVGGAEPPRRDKKDKPAQARPAAAGLYGSELGGRMLRTATAKSADLLYRDGQVDDAHVELVAAIDTSSKRPDPDLAGLVEALHVLSEVCRYGGRAGGIGDTACA